jgi:hypothetical protein
MTTTFAVFLIGLLAAIFPSLPWAADFSPKTPPARECVALDERAASQGYAEERVPHGALWARQAVLRESPSERFPYVIGWFNGTTAYPCARTGVSSTIEIDHVEIIESQNGKENVIFSEEYLGDGQLTDAEGALFIRSPKWFGTGQTEKMASADIRNGILVVDVAKSSDRIAHWWTKRVPAKAGARYFVSVRARIQGDARLQLGADYWVSADAPYSGYHPECKGTNNCEGWVSQWFGDTKGQWKIFRAPLTR